MTDQQPATAPPLPREEPPIPDLSQNSVIRVERAIAEERRAFARSTAARQPTAGALEVGGGCAVYTGDGLFSNRAFALGLTATLEPTDLDRIEAFYAERRAPVEIEVASAAEPALLGLLADRGYRLRRFRNIFAHFLDELPPAPADISIEEVDPAVTDSRDTWSDLLLEGFGYDRVEDVRRVEEWNAALLATPGLIALIARRGSRPAGSASMLVLGPIAVLGGAATRPADRCRGVQSALIAARLRLARHAGCDLAVVTADPGTSSARNCERAGFRLVCTHAVMRHAA